MERNTQDVLSAINSIIDDMHPDQLEKVAAVLKATKEENGQIITVLALHLQMLAGIKLVDQAKYEFKNL